MVYNENNIVKMGTDVEMYKLLLTDWLAGWLAD
jgi:hypothetical protein